MITHLTGGKTVLNPNVLYVVKQYGNLAEYETPADQWPTIVLAEAQDRRLPIPDVNDIEAPIELEITVEGIQEAITMLNEADPVVVWFLNELMRVRKTTTRQTYETTVNHDELFLIIGSTERREISPFPAALNLEMLKGIISYIIMLFDLEMNDAVAEIFKTLKIAAEEREVIVPEVR